MVTAEDLPPLTDDDLRRSIRLLVEFGRWLKRSLDDFVTTRD
jgi:hypothetical protein